MSKFELSMVSDYVKTWDYKDAIREIVQNALDQSLMMATDSISSN